MTQTFTTTLSGDEVGPTGLRVPPEVMAALGPRKNPAVLVGFAGHTYRSTVAVRGGAFMIPVSAARRAAAGVRAGDTLEVTLDLDLEPRGAQLPADLSAALDAQAGATGAFAALAPSKRKETVRQLEEAKTPETRERRLAKILTALGQG
ncbi:YdeI/OmpD-associated family protein [Deinococcus sp.]|uniref:YdeI/OmpD-associated family protein n=1 Tax=Deinococcus sp. TaxID=47478 RepID=UPI003C7E1F82